MFQNIMGPQSVNRMRNNEPGFPVMGGMGVFPTGGRQVGTGRFVATSPSDPAMPTQILLDRYIPKLKLLLID